jgi:hypothetical protein
VSGWAGVGPTVLFELQLHVGALLNSASRGSLRPSPASASFRACATTVLKRLAWTAVIFAAVRFADWVQRERRPRPRQRKRHEPSQLTGLPPGWARQRGAQRLER